MVYETGNRTVDDAVTTLLDGGQLDRTDALALMAQPVEDLAPAADVVRSHFGDDTVDACSIVNAKAGNCAEDCGFCAQSVHFDTGIETYGFLGPEEVLAAAKRAERDGAQRFGIVVAEKGVSKERRPDEWDEVIQAIRLVRDETDIEVDASLGILTQEEAEILAAEGINHYNHNIETSPRYFPEVVSTHSFEDRVKTLERAKSVGMDLCAGVILGMGESPTDRVDAALALRDIGISSLPVNILNPVAGTPLGDDGSAEITTEEIIKTIAVYRMLHPEARVRLTGGREVNLSPDEQHLPFEAGADGILTGDYLTTEGQSPGDDLEIIERAGLEPNMEANEFDPETVKDGCTDSDSAVETAAGTAVTNVNVTED
ncbi:biotin synthase BioB (plasmid) [Haloferax mediterranei ATCC 33500]|uniref:Biotin synthase n=1 Tax=Haloferax mediterranei (strain ATCC 33500 / DSM 1411 / JCM 8866 / NBRC 14739 / NCIMB 2177 / R-4) TaxID=523841 RepID=I3R9K4_HALMT|nr:biotin synthase BioB [Haloferax mediterranei]AFK20914.1 biotin synthase [Haloferax mediterranei ATCC 33500]AHZ24217.1 biotin synthase [Haloferax mediterranei ATCC 33500]EMA05296.1 biotin synthase [Haloferax mediterranei ATCC 33500]MDX5989902.1 biotin synthase BioB [Haloferax mediterranei ATCC 33500]QCQ77343.1 biotin synthase BioB [Haloferax mediterranei ATCC 33500]